MGGQLDAARLLVRDARAEFADVSSVAAALAACERRMAEPLRVALAGTLKSGKSTLLNALIGEEIAPTDATECTRVVTWFARADAPRIELTQRDGQRIELPVRRRDGRLRLELDGVPVERVANLAVGWPSALLADYTLIDTPGTSSNTPGVSERTWEFLAPDGAACQADALVYLMRSPHEEDLELLHRIQQGRRADQLGVIVVLSRADEDGGGMESAHEQASRLRGDPRLPGDLLAVSGLLAVCGQTLRQAEFRVLSALARLPAEVARRALLAPGRFARFALPDTTEEERERLIRRFGMVAVKAAVELVRRGAGDAPALASALVEHSGLATLAHTVDARFGARHQQLKAHAGMRELRAILAGQPYRRASRLVRAADRLLADSHALTELRVLAELPTVSAPDPVRRVLEQLLGGRGIAAHTRLGLPPGAAATELEAQARQALAHLHARLAEPVLDAPTARTYRAAIRSCEAILAG
jgi:dynamin family protein